MDIRHQGDYDWLLKHYKNCIQRVRVTADEAIRISRGWKFQEGVDDGPSECSLDYVTDWDLIIRNNDDGGVGLHQSLQTILSWIQEAVEK